MNEYCKKTCLNTSTYFHYISGGGEKISSNTETYLLSGQEKINLLINALW